MKLFSKIQKTFGITKGEAFVSLIILIGLTIGLIIQISRTDSNSSENHKKTIEQLLAEIDSLSELQRRQFVGSDSAGNPREIIPKKTKTKKVEKFTVNLNTASKVQLMRLPGVGEKTALKILSYRTETPFAAIEDIKNIKGIGEKKFEKMRSYIVVD